jgi:hypothetical protein
MSLHGSGFVLTQALGGCCAVTIYPSVLTAAMQSTITECSITSLPAFPIMQT